MGGFDDAFQIVGFVGGLMFPISTGFQVVRVFRTKSAKDISYGWQAIFMFAHILYLIYSIHFGLWVIYSTQLADLAVMLVLLLLKIYYDHFYSKRSKRRAATS